MSEYSKHLYCLIYPNSALVASQLEAKDFGRHYAVGYPKNYKGKVIFAEIDINYRHPYFAIDEVLEECKSVDGRPKRTKFISSYRVLEHLSTDSFMCLYLVTRSGRILQLKKSNSYEITHQPESIRIYQLMAPLYYLVASNLTPPQFGEYVSVTPHKGVPKSAMIQIDIDIDSILGNTEEILYSSPLPSVHAEYLRQALIELRDHPEKRSKTVSLNSIFDQLPFTKIKHGVWINEKDKQIFYPIPSLEELETKHFYWFKDASY